MSKNERIDPDLHDRIWFHWPFEPEFEGMRVVEYSGDENEDTAQKIVDFLEGEKSKVRDMDALVDSVEVDWLAEYDKPVRDALTLEIEHELGDVHMHWTVSLDMRKAGSSYQLREVEEWSDLCEKSDVLAVEEVLMRLSYSEIHLGRGGIEAFYSCMYAFLKEHERDMRTPYDVDVFIDTFEYKAVEDVVEAKRRALKPAVLHELRRAKRQAEKVSTGIPQLDRMLCGGFQRGGIYVVAGDPASGKTALAVQSSMFSANQLADNEVALYFMLDQGGKSEILKRCVSLSHAITATMDGRPREGLELSRCGQWTDEELDMGTREYEALSSGRLIVRSNADLEEIMGAIDKAKDARLRPRMLCIDYYQLIQLKGSSVASDAEIASDVMCELRQWSYDSGAFVLLCGQYTKQAIERHQGGQPARMTDLLGGVDVPYQAEAVLCITNDMDGTGQITIADCKGRHSGNSAKSEREAALTLDGEHGYIF